MKSRAVRGPCVPGVCIAPSPPQALGEAPGPHRQGRTRSHAARPTSSSSAPTRCSSEDRIYVSGRPDSKISRMVFAARLSVDTGLVAISGTLLSVCSLEH